MAYILFVVNFIINWCLIFIIIAFGLQYLNGTWAMVATLTTIILIGAILFFSTIGAKFLRIGIKHRPLTKHEANYLNPILDEVFNRAGLKKAPKIFMQEEKHPNAMVVGDAMIITTGLLTIAHRDEVAAIIAHECGHILNKDLIFVTINYAASKMSDIMLIIGVGLVTIISLNGRIPFIYLPYIMIAGALRIIRWVLLKIVDVNLLIINRQYEYKADSFAANIGYKEATLSYLSKIKDMYPQTDKISLFNTHPTISKRIEALI